MKKLVSLMLVSAIAVSAFTLSACKGDNVEQSSMGESSSQSAPESSVESVIEISVEASKPPITDTQLEQLNENISNYTGVPEFTCTSDKIDAEEISENITLSLITDNKSNSFNTLLSKQFIIAAKDAGFKKTVSIDTDGTTSSYSDALANIIKNRDKAVMMFGNIEKDEISSSIERVQANGIKVISAGNAGVDQTEHYVDNIVPINYQLIGQLLADWAIVKQNGKLNALAINCVSSGKSNAVYAGFAEEFQKYVSSGYCTTLNVSSIEIGNGLASKVKTALTDDPNLNYVIVFDDSAINDTVSGVKQSRKSINIIATGGSTEAFDVAKNSEIEMLVAQSYEWTAYAMVDYTLRVLAKAELPKEQDVPVRIVTSKSIGEELKEYDDDDIDGFHEICFGGAFVQGYSTLWNL